ncbi:MAG: cysteine--tRNA ligase [Verrucomicrobia bacterium]|nr:cysteine--tRNA ligase [Verrucomicrobiota bacterium]
MSLKLYNTMSRSLEEFHPVANNHVRMYTCGPTVYDHAHIGNFRAYMFEDLLRRYLKYCGYEVTHVMNLTDVDDKTIRACIAEDLPLKEYTSTYIKAFFEDLDRLGIERAEHYPAATDHIPEMIELIEKLQEKGFAYQSEDGSVYFSIGKFKDYGKLSHLDLSGMQSGARVAQDEYEKDNAADFALWKAWDEKDGDVAWDSPWGRGRPGWHIECSAMSMRYLGETFDIHMGGVDNMFPHHEDEIAQSECATGKMFAKYWLHCAHLIVDGKKMSKSLNNFYTLRDILDKGYSGREIRFVLISTHYRQPLNFTFEVLDSARASLARLDEFIRRLKELASENATPEDLPAWARKAEDGFKAGLDNDLNISGAFAAVFDMVTAGNRAMDSAEVTGDSARAILTLLHSWDSALGILEPPPDEADEETLRMVEMRQQARRNKDWGEADRLRDELAARGWVVKDTPEGPKLRRS